VIDKVNKIFAALAKVHAIAYLLVGGFCTATLYMFLLDMKINMELLRTIGYTGLFAMVAHFIFSKLFYERYELGSKYLPKTNSGIVKTDTYFYTKINSNITSTKKLAGYIYVILRIWALIGFGFILFFLPLFWIVKGLGF